MPQLAKALPNGWYAAMVRWLPGDVVIQITSTGAPANRPTVVLRLWGEFALFRAYAAAVLVAGALCCSATGALSPGSGESGGR